MTRETDPALSRSRHRQHPGAVYIPSHVEVLRAYLLRGGRLTKFKGILASIAPTLAGAALVAGVASAPAMAADVNIDQTAAGSGGTAITTPINSQNQTAGTGNVTIKADDVDAARTSKAGIAVDNNSGQGATTTVTVKNVSGGGGGTGINNAAVFLNNTNAANTTGQINFKATGNVVGDAGGNNSSIWIGNFNGGKVNVDVDGNVGSADASGNPNSAPYGIFIGPGQHPNNTGSRKTTADAVGDTAVDLNVGGTVYATQDGVTLDAGNNNSAQQNSINATVGGVNASGNGIILNHGGKGDATITVGSKGVSAGKFGIYATDTANGDLIIDTSAGAINGGTSGVRVSKNAGAAPSVANSNLTINVGDVTANSQGGNGAAIDIENRSPGGATTLNATGTITNTSGHAIRINGTDGSVDGALGGPLTIKVRKLVAGTVLAGGGLATGGGAGIQIAGSVGTTSAPQATKITTGDINASADGVQTLSGVLLNGDTTIKMGAITAGSDGIDVASGLGTLTITSTSIKAGHTGIDTTRSAAGTKTIVDMTDDGTLEAGVAAGTADGTAAAAAMSDGADDATVTIGNATVAGGFGMGAGSDTLTFNGTDMTNIGKLDGGTAGERNTLNLNHITWAPVTPQANIVNWDAIDANDSTLTLADGDSVTAGQVNLNDTMIKALGSFTVYGNLSMDPSTVDMQNGHAGDIFTVGGNYNAIGAGNALKIDADFANNVADKLNVGGAISGVTTLDVNNVTADPVKSTGKDVVVATSGTPSGVTAKNFKLSGGPVVSGIWNYSLADSNTDNKAAPDTVVLHATVNALGATYSAALGSLADTFGALPTLEQRVGNREWLAKGNGGLFQGVWVRFNGSHSTTTPQHGNVNYSTDNDAWGVQVGADFKLYQNNDGRIVTGITGQYKGMNADVNTTAGQGGINAHGGGGGFNVTWYGVKGAYVDFQGQYNKVDANLSTDKTGTATNNLDGTSKAVSLELGKRLLLTPDGKNVLVPQAQISWGLFSTDPFKNRFGDKVDLGDEVTSTARMGVAYEFHPGGINLEKPNRDGKMFYGIFNVLQGLSPHTRVNTQGTPLKTTRARTWGEIGFGGSLVVHTNVMLYGEVDYRQAFQSFDNARNNAVAGTIGVRIGFGCATDNCATPPSGKKVKVVPLLKGGRD